MTISPTGAAVHTRGLKRGQDYNWYVYAGELRLFNDAIEIHRLALRDVGGDAPRLAMLIKDNYIGLLIADMPTARIDHGHREILTTLYVEFPIEAQQAVTTTLTHLLIVEPEDYKNKIQPFMTYAEKLYESIESNNFDLQSFDLSGLFENNIKKSKTLKLAKTLLPSNEENFAICANSLVKWKIPEKTTFCFLSTGRVGIDRCRQLADKVDYCLFLSLSSEVTKKMHFKSANNSIMNKALIIVLIIVSVASLVFFSQLRQELLDVNHEMAKLRVDVASKNTQLLKLQQNSKETIIESNQTKQNLTRTETKLTETKRVLSKATHELKLTKQALTTTQQALIDVYKELEKSLVISQKNEDLLIKTQQTLTTTQTQLSDTQQQLTDLNNKYHQTKTELNNLKNFGGMPSLYR